MKCLNCNANLLANQEKYCSKKCSITATNSLFPKRKLEGSCKLCSKACAKSKTFCSSECLNASKQKISKEQKKKRKSDSTKKAVKNFRRNQKLKGIEYLGGSCSSCGYSKCANAMHFHHVNPKEKSFQISGKSISWEKLKTELDKCILLCANCHAEAHAKEIDQTKIEN